MRTIILAALAAFSAIALAACETSGGTLMSRNQVMEVSRRMTAEYAAAWNANDMNRFGALYAEEARHVTMSGEFLRGRDQIVAAHRANRARYAENVRMATRLEGARAITNIVNWRDGLKADQPVALAIEEEDGVALARFRAV